MNLLKPIQLLALAFVGVATLCASTAFAQANYPNKPINFIVPYGAGGGADARSRQIAQKMSVILKQPIIVDNKPGAGGNIGIDAVVKSKPDGYTLAITPASSTLAAAMHLFKKVSFDPQSPHARKLYDAFQGLLSGTVADKHGWLYPIFKD